MWPWPDDSDDERGFFFPNFFGSEEHVDDEEEEGQTFGSYSSRIFFALFVLLFAALLALFYVLYRFLPPLLMQVWQYSANSLGKLIITVLLVALALGLFWLREKRRLLYGMIELCFGISSIWDAVGQARLDHAKWAVVAGAIYLVVRGLDNW